MEMSTKAPTLFMSPLTKERRDSLVKQGYIRRIGNDIPIREINDVDYWYVIFRNESAEQVIGLWSSPEFTAEEIALAQEKGVLLVSSKDILEIVQYGIDNLVSIAINSGISHKEVYKISKRYKQLIEVAKLQGVELSDKEKQGLLQDIAVNIINAKIIGEKLYREKRARRRQWIRNKIQGRKMTKEQVVNRTIRTTISMGLFYGIYRLADRYIGPFVLQTRTTIVLCFIWVFLSIGLANRKADESQSTENPHDK